MVIDVRAGWRGKGVLASQHVGRMFQLNFTCFKILF